MQKIIIDEPYEFVPPYPGRFWTRLLRFWLPLYLRRTWGITAWEFRGIEHLRSSLTAGHGILLTPNHCRPCDPMVLGLLSVRLKQPFYCVASWHLFKHSRFQTWVLRRFGAFSIYREGMDREALKASTNILVEADRPLIIFPEGIVTRTNDRLGTLLEGPAFIARSAAKQRAKATPPGQVVVHPVALKYIFGGDIQAAVDPVLDQIEKRLTWLPQRGVPYVDRVTRIGEALLALKEIEYIGKPQPGTLTERIAGLIDCLLGPLEQEWLAGRKDGSALERIKKLRTAILPDLVTGEISEEERARRWRQLAAIYLAQLASCYPPDYLRSRPTRERLLETVERFEEDMTDTVRIHRPLRVVIQVGEAVVVPAGRDRSSSGDPVMDQIEQQLQTMLDQQGSESQLLPGA